MYIKVVQLEETRIIHSTQCIAKILGGKDEKKLQLISGKGS